MKFIKKTDVVIILIVIIFCLIGFFIYKSHFADKPAVAEIYYKSNLVEVIDLTNPKERTFSIPQNNNVIFQVYSDGSICFLESDCPDKICILSGRLDTIGQTAACLPNEIILKITPKENRKSDDIDIVAG
ncbi:MAG: NusG domain II-containing protein [Clostridiales bacterium]|nr:NusG domain II-containing protein [Clostridiales bacterium]